MPARHATDPRNHAVNARASPTSGEKTSVVVSLDEETYLTLALRYKDLAGGGGGGGGGSAYIVETHLTEIDTSRIDADYMNSRFDKYLKALEAGEASDQERRDLLDDLHGQFALLSQDEQKHANMFLHDVANGDIELVPGKTFRDYITEYQLTEKEARTRLVRDELGVDEGLLRQLLSLTPTENTLTSSVALISCSPASRSTLPEPCSSAWRGNRSPSLRLESGRVAS